VQQGWTRADIQAMSSIGGGGLPPGATPGSSSVAGQGGNVVAPAGTGAELQLGQLYSAEVTDLLDGKTELLIGNRYLLAASPFNFSVGDRVTLRLTQQTPQLLTFQLALAGAGGGLGAPAEMGEAAGELSTLLRAAGLEDTPTTRNVVTLLLQSGLPLTQRTFSELDQLLAALPGLPLTGFIPLYKELLERGLQPSQAVLRQLALLSAQRPDAAGLLAGALPLRPPGRPRRGPVPPEDSPRDNTADEPADEPAVTAAELRMLAQWLYSSPEHRMAQVLLGAKPADSRPEETTVELYDQRNVSPRDPAVAGALGLTTALRVRHALKPGQGTLLLPLAFDGEPVPARLDFRQLEQRYYQRDFHLRLSLTTRDQGPVEVLLHTHGSGLSISILASEPATAEAYAAEAEELRASLAAADSGYVLHRLETGVASLGVSAPVAETLP
jgi:hypothetical protein